MFTVLQTVVNYLERCQELSRISLKSENMDDFDMPNTPSPSGRDPTGILRTKIQLGRKPSVIMPFYLMKSELPPPAPITGSTNMLSYYGLNHAWSKFCGTKKLKEELSAFLPHLPGNIDLPGSQDNSSLKSLTEKPPILGKEIHPLSTSALAGFKLSAGSIPDGLKPFGSVSLTDKKRHKRKHEKTTEDDKEDESSAALDGDKKAKKLKKDEEKERKKKKKKDKKKKKSGPDETNPTSVPTSLAHATDFLSYTF